MRRILPSHYPNSFAEAKNEDVFFLQLSRHTHGGLNWAIKLFNKGYLRGLYQEISTKGKTAYLYVSNGTGIWAEMPARFGSQNEIMVISFKHN